MMDEVKAGKIDCIAVKDLSRFGRNYIETGEYLEQIFPFMGVRFLAINDGLDNEGKNNNVDALIVSLKNLINDVYAKDLSQKIISSLRTKQQNGDYIGGLPPYGYQKSEENHNKLVIDEEVVHIVRDIFKWKAEGLGDTNIARRLNQLDIPSPLKRRIEKGETKKTGKAILFLWGDRAIRSITTNPIYIGHMVQGRQKQSLAENMPCKKIPMSEWIIVENTHEPVVDEETFAKAQEMRSANTNDFYKNYDKSKHISKEKHLLKGLLRCGQCGSRLSRRKISSISAGYEFYCPAKHKNLGTLCTHKKVKETVLHDTILSSIKGKMKEADALTATLERLNKQHSSSTNENNLKKRMSKLQNELKKITQLKASLYESYADKLLTENEYVYSKQKYTNQIDNIQQQLVCLQEESVTQSETLTPKNKWLQALSRFTDHNELSREMVHTLINQVMVGSNSEFHIIWNFKSDYEAICAYTGEVLV